MCQVIPVWLRWGRSLILGILLKGISSTMAPPSQRLPCGQVQTLAVCTAVWCTCYRVILCVCMQLCMCVCVCACMPAYVRACVCACVQLCSILAIER